MINNKRRTYIRTKKEAEGKRIVFTEIEINAAPAIVRAKFLDFEKWSEWNTVIPSITIKNGDINNLDTKPTLDLTLDFGRKGDPTQAPAFPKVTTNNEEAFVWGIYASIVITAEHVFIFEPIKNGKATRHVHYERMQGVLGPVFLTKDVKANMLRRYTAMNEALKRICEEG